jgi:hypothetical protein
MEQAMRPFTATAIAIFTIIAVVHLVRLFTRWEVVIAGFVVPVWWSAPGCIIAGGLAFMLWRETRA